MFARRKKRASTPYSFQQTTCHVTNVYTVEEKKYRIIFLYEKNKSIILHSFARKANNNKLHFISPIHLPYLHASEYILFIKEIPSSNFNYKCFLS